MDPRTPDRPLYLEPASFHSRLEPASVATTSFLVSAVPNSSVELVLANCVPARAGIIVAHKRVGASGFCSLRPNEVVDAIRESGICIGRFEVHDGGSASTTDTWYVDTARLPSCDVDPDSIAGLPRSLGDAIRIIRAVKSNTLQHMPDVKGVLPLSARQMAALWLWTAKRLDEGIDSCQAIDCTDPESRHVLNRLSALLKRTASLEGASDAVLQAEQLIQDWDQFDPHKQLQSLGLDLDRWSRILKSKRDRIQGIADVDRCAAEAIAAIQAGASTRDVPILLKNAWHQYLLAEQFEPASAHEFLKDAADHLHVACDLPLPWSDIRQLLLMLCYLRLALIRAFLKRVTTLPPPRYCQPAWQQLRAIADNLEGRLHAERCAVDSSGIAAISPRRDDQALSRALAGGTNQWLHAAQGCWLGAWLGWRWTHFADRPAIEKQQSYDALLSKVMLIPRGPDCNDIMNEIQRKIPGVWQ
jgi:hypothetical protein